MNFKTDENLPLELAELLRDVDHDVRTVWDQDLRGANDSTIAAVCRQERRVLMTLDVDFAAANTFVPSDFAGIIVSRVHLQDKRHLLQVAKGLLPLLTMDDLNGKLWIVEEHRVRVRGPE
ncbi:MAG: DUF5615 family PIN-like protein [Limisphaerales bacterium]